MGEGPRFFEDAIDSENNRFYRKWILDDVIQADLESWDYRDYMLRCLVDLVHMQGFWVKFIRNRGPRIGESGRIIRLEHVPYRKCRFEYPDDRHDLPQNVYVGDWPFPDPDRLAKYPVFNPADPFRHPVSVGYFNIYSFCRDFIAKKDAGKACQLYEQAIYFDPNYKEAYLKFADVYKGASPQLAIEKLEQLKNLDPSCVAADKKLAEVYYLNNKFDKAAEAYAHFINTPEATEDDLTKYSFALFLNHDFEKSLQIALMGLQKNPRDAAFNRLAMYNYTDLKRYDEAMKAADAFFKESDKADFSYLDYMYFGHLLNAVKKYDQAVEAYMKAITLDPAKTDLWREVSSSYELNNEFTKAIEAYKKYSESLSADKRTPDVQFQIGKLYYEKGTQSDTLTVSLDERKAALVSADSIFTEIAKVAPDSYLGNFWRARTNSALDPETTQGLAKPYYEEVAAFLIDKNDPRYNSALIECYSYLGYYYLVANKLPESKEYWNKILAIDPANATAKRALDGIK